MSFSWGELDYWKSNDWYLIQERLHGLEKEEKEYCPGYGLLFASLSATPFAKVRVVLMGQDPYPTLNHCTGLAFSIPETVERRKYPPTLVNILTEYCSDLQYPFPSTGNLQVWAKEGVLLWNAYPSCEKGKSASHRWPEWEALTREIVRRLDQSRQCVFILLGNYARNWAGSLNSSPVVQTSHPSPLGARAGFFGSRIFTRANLLLKEPINWKLL